MSVATSMPAPRPREVRRPRLSEEVFGFRWSELVPCAIGSDGEVLRLAGYEEVRAFLAEHHDAILAPEVAGSRFSQLEESPTKARFCERMADCFVFEHEARTVGVFVGQVSDWSTYYLRYLAMHPAHRGRGAVLGLVQTVGDFLQRHGFERLETDVSVSHRRQLQRLLRDGFYPMGVLQSERWGASVHFVKFLSRPHESVYLDQFSAGIRS